MAARGGEIPKTAARGGDPNDSGCEGRRYTMTARLTGILGWYYDWYYDWY